MSILLYPILLFYSSSSTFGTFHASAAKVPGPLRALLARKGNSAMGRQAFAGNARLAGRHLRLLPLCVTCAKRPLTFGARDRVDRNPARQAKRWTGIPTLARHAAFRALAGTFARTHARVHHDQSLYLVPLVSTRQARGICSVIFAQRGNLRATRHRLPRLPPLG